MQIEMTIKGLMVDPITNTPIVILRDKEGQKVLPIWVGIFEANAIALQIENIATPRPMTHDLLRNVIHDLNAEVQKIVVCDLQENTFYALIYLGVNGDTVASVTLSSTGAAATADEIDPLVGAHVLNTEDGLQQPLLQHVAVEGVDDARSGHACALEIHGVPLARDVHRHLTLL